MSAGGQGGKTRTRALFKKGQKCVILFLEDDEETGQKVDTYYPAVVGYY